MVTHFVKVRNLSRDRWSLNQIILVYFYIILSRSESHFHILFPPFKNAVAYLLSLLLKTLCTS